MEQTAYDVAIVGCGPAGIQAAIHAARRKARVLMLGRPAGSALLRGHIENYAFVAGVTPGEDLLRAGLDQVRGFGAELVEEDLLHLVQEEGGFLLRLESGREIRAGAVILAMGTSKKKLGVPGEKEFLGRGVSYCVDCDANFFRKADVCVAGSGSAAVDGALTLEKTAGKVSLIAEKLEVSPELEKRLAASAVERVEGKIARIEGEMPRGVTAVALADGRTLAVEGVFIEMGAKGTLDLATQLGVALDSDTMRHIAVNRRQETNVPGVYAAGDITGPPFQMAKAVGEGCVAGLEAAAWALRKGDGPATD